jgi:hypothetical protein
MTENDRLEPSAPTEEEELDDFDYVDPLKRDPDDDALPGLDPIVPPVPPES